jgi:hypothetical protein
VISVAIDLHGLYDKVDWSRQLDSRVSHRGTVDEIRKLLKGRRLSHLFAEYRRMPEEYGRSVIEPTRNVLIPSLIATDDMLCEHGCVAYLPMLPSAKDMVDCVAAEDNPLYMASKSVDSGIDASCLRPCLPFQRLHMHSK